MHSLNRGPESRNGCLSTGLSFFEATHFPWCARDMTSNPDAILRGPAEKKKAPTGSGKSWAQDEPTNHLDLDAVLLTQREMRFTWAVWQGLYEP